MLYQLEFPYSRQSIVVVFEAIQNARSARFIRSKTLALRARVLNLIKRSYSCFKYYVKRGNNVLTVIRMASAMVLQWGNYCDVITVFA